MRRKGETGLFAGVREIVDQTLGVDDFTTKTAADTLTKHGFGLGTAMLVQDLFIRLDSNWALTRPKALPSQQNFRWNCPQTSIADRNASAEVTLERALMGALATAGRTDWSNQVPLISGIAGPHAFKRRAIDLVWRQGESCFEFVELKMTSDDTPVFAAIEILVYGLLWLLSRRDRKVLGYAANPILDAQELRLSVLAPRDYYSRYSIGPLAIAVNDGLRKLGQQHGVVMEFRFTAFPAPFPWSRDPRDPPKPSGNNLIALLDGRETV